MSTTGVHFALNPEQATELLAAKDDETLLNFLEQTEEAWDEEWLLKTDHAWDAIHRFLTDGQLGSENGEYPNRLAVIGGRQLYTGDDYLVTFISPKEVEDVAASLQLVNKKTTCDKFFLIDKDDYGEEMSKEAFDIIWAHFEALRAFFKKAAAAKRPVVFTVDLIDFA